MRKSILLLGMFAATAAMAQKTGNPTRYGKSITETDLKKHLYIVAGKEMEGRETATEGQRKAAAYIENEFKRIGLTPGNNGAYQMFFNVYTDSLEKASIQVNGKKFDLDKDFTVNMGLNYSATIPAREVVFVGAGVIDSSKNDYANADVKGKVILVMPGTAAPAANTRRMSYAVQEAAMKNGAAAILVVQNNFPRKAMNAKGNASVNGFRSTIYPNTFYISEAIAKEILGSDLDAAKAGSLQAKSYQTELLLDFRKIQLTAQSSNVVGVIEGSDKKDEFLVLTSHYDHLGKRDTVIYYGADDDGSGTVSVIELAEAFATAKKDGKGPRRSIVFMTVSGEEKGLWGSAYYGDNPIFPLDKTTANLNIDMIGRIDPKRKQGDSTNYVYVVGDDKLSTDLRPISEAVNKKYSKLELDYKFNDPKDTERIYYRSDHYNFAKKGVPIIFYFNGTHADYHRPTDTPDKINYDVMEKRARFVFYTAWEMANRNDMLKRDLKLDVGVR
ncbi:MAG: M28 family peptidase [Flavitalea sp.]